MGKHENHKKHEKHKKDKSKRDKRKKSEKESKKKKSKSDRSARSADKQVVRNIITNDDYFLKSEVIGNSTYEICYVERLNFRNSEFG